MKIPESEASVWPQVTANCDIGELPCIKAGWRLDWDNNKIADYLRSAGLSDEQIESVQIMVVSVRGLAARAISREALQENGIDDDIGGVVERETHQMTLTMGVFGGSYGQHCLNSLFAHELQHLVESFTMSDKARDQEDAESATAVLKSFGYSVDGDWRETLKGIDSPEILRAIYKNRPAEVRAEAVCEQYPPEAFFTLTHDDYKDD
ncbi:MAG: hypothetical protein LBU20_02755 [Candidatus Nomurabacteria bacterium]|jgi:hypothetical protein|nr:hypothetical protein [Candidatus Nomurabacteria bacterium]